ncbi:MAG: helix-turn-helix transcriptional regulator [Bacilli bacterium]|nr:helix-turn-helix transcriptional regulator [Bacilli bacterium]
MTLGEKLKSIRKRFGLSQEQLAEIMNVSRQAITKWESDGGIPDVSNLQELAKVFGITVDYLLNDNNELPALSMTKKLDKDKYNGKIFSYSEILKEYYPEPWEVYSLIRDKKMSKLETTFDLIIGAGTLGFADALNDLSPFYLVVKDNLKMLVNIKDWTLRVYELPSDTNIKKFVYGKNRFQMCGKVNL